MPSSIPRSSDFIVGVRVRVGGRASGKGLIIQEGRGRLIRGLVPALVRDRYSACANAPFPAPVVVPSRCPGPHRRLAILWVETYQRLSNCCSPRLVLSGLTNARLIREG